jgi:hypothetical protein
VTVKTSKALNFTSLANTDLTAFNTAVAAGEVPVGTLVFNETTGELYTVALTPSGGVALSPVAQSFTALSAVDLSAAEGKAVQLKATGEVELCGVGRPASGVVVGTPLAAVGSPVRILRSGYGRVRLGATIAAGVFVASDATGLAKAAVRANVDGADVNGSHAFAMLLEGGNNGDLVSAYIDRYGLLPTNFE